MVARPLPAGSFPPFDAGDRQWVDDRADRVTARELGWLTFAYAARMGRVARWSAAHQEWHAETGTVSAFDLARIRRVAALTGRAALDVDLPACCRVARPEGGAFALRGSVFDTRDQPADRIVGPPESDFK